MSAGVGVADQSINTVLGTLGLRLDLQAIVVGTAGIGDVGDDVELKVSAEIRRVNERAARTTADGVARYAAAGTGGVHVKVVAEGEDVGAARTGVANSEDDVTGQLVFDVNVELLNGAQFKIR